MPAILHILNNRVWLLLLAGLALVGFIFLIEVLGTVASSGTGDLFTPASTDDPQIALPGVGGAFSNVLAAVAVIVPLVGLLAFRHRLLEGGLSLSNRPLVLASLAGILVAAAGIIVAFSGLLNSGIDNSQHQAIRTSVDPRGVIVLSMFFLSVALVGIMRPQFLLVVLFGWLLFGLLTAFFGVLGSSPDEEAGVSFDYLVMMVLLGYVFTLPIALALGGGKLLIGHLAVYVAVGFLFVYTGQDRFDHLAPGADFSTEAVPVGAVGVVITPLLVLVVLTVATGSVCVAIIATYSFLRDSRSRQVEGLPAWTAITRWTMGPLVLGILYSQFISPGMTGLDLVNGPEEIRQSRTSDLALRNYRERVGDFTDVSKFDGTSGLPRGVGGPAISQASTEPAEGTTNQDNPESISDGGAVTAADGEEGRVLDASPGFVENLWVLITVALIVVITLAYSGVRLDFFRWPRAVSLFRKVRREDDPEGEEQPIEGARPET